MKKYILPLLLLFIVPALSVCQTVYINPHKTLQTIDGFGASDCWTVHYVGNYFSEAEKEKAARLLFSDRFDAAGNPEGIALSIWRVNLGGGTIEQGDSSRLMTDITRRAECFIDAAGTYNWKKQAGQQWFMKKAKDYGCSSFVAFSNTPPVCFTRNGKGFAPKGGNSNLHPDRYDDFARFLVNVVRHFKNEKINFDYISPVNEPQWPWDGTYQEGSPWQNDEIKKLVVLLDREIRKAKLSSKIMITEAGAWDNLYKEIGRASNQIEAFFNPNSPCYVGNLRSIEPMVAGHSYWTDAKNDQLKEVRTKVKEKADVYGLKVLQTEWSLLNNTPLENFPATYKDATYNDIALYMAKVIYADLVYAGVSSWSFWTSMDIELWGFKNRYNLVRLHTPDGDVNSIVKGGTVSAVKTLWTLGHYSRFIRPGYKRIAMTGVDDLSSVMGTSYLSPDGKTIVSVYTNLTPEEQRFTIHCDGQPALTGKWYLTDEMHDLTFMGMSNLDNTLVLPAKSTVTIVYEVI